MPTFATLKLVGYCALGMLVAALILALSMERRHSRKLTERNVELASELKRISTAKNEQKAETSKNIESAKDRIILVEREAKRVEEAELPGQCRTPSEVLQAGL